MDAEEQMQREHSQQMPSVDLLISNEDLALTFTGLPRHTGAGEMTFGPWPKAER